MPVALDLDAIAVGIAARFAPGALTAPTGYSTVRQSSATPIAQIGVTPVVLVTIDAGTFEDGNGTRIGEHAFFVRFYLDQVNDTERSEVALRKWASVLIDQMKGAVQLGGITFVTRAVVESYKVGMLLHGNLTYAGIEIVVAVTTSDSWLPVA